MTGDKRKLNMRIDFLNSFIIHTDLYDKHLKMVEQLPTEKLNGQSYWLAFILRIFSEQKHA